MYLKTRMAKPHPSFFAMGMSPQRYEDMGDADVAEELVLLIVHLSIWTYEIPRGIS
jgi:hypothetical protein